MTHPTAPTSPAPFGPVVAWLVERAKLDDGARAAATKAMPAALAPGAADPGPLVEALLLAGKPAEALRVVGCALPPREGIWWASVAARHATEIAQARADAARSAPPSEDEAPLPPTALERAALTAVERWITQPTDEHRRAAWEIAQAAGLETPAGCVAGAIYFTGGSITPPNGPYVPPAAGLHVIMVSTATLLAAVQTDPARLGEVAGALAQQGVEVIRRLGGWEAAVLVAKQTFDAQAYQHAEASKPPTLPES